MRKSTAIQIGAIVVLALITAFTWMGYNYDNFLLWSMDKKNITAMCFCSLAILYCLIIYLQFTNKKVVDNKNYYCSENERYREENFQFRTDLSHLRELNENLKVENKLLKVAVKTKKRK